MFSDIRFVCLLLRLGGDHVFSPVKRYFRGGMLFLCGGKTVFLPEAGGLVANAQGSRAVTREIPFVPLDFFDQFSLGCDAGLDLLLFGNRANGLQIHDESPGLRIN
jgi:hypothetical protein